MGGPKKRTELEAAKQATAILTNQHHDGDDYHDNEGLLGSQDTDANFKPASDQEVDALLFKRALQRDIQAVVDHEAKTQTIYNNALTVLYDGTKSDADYQKLENITAGDHEQAKERIREKIQAAEASAKEALEQSIDRVALGIPKDVPLPENAIANIWNSDAIDGENLEHRIREQFNLAGVTATRKINPDDAPAGLLGKINFYRKHFNKPFVLQDAKAPAETVVHHSQVISRIKKTYADMADCLAARAKENGESEDDIAEQIAYLESHYHDTIDSYYAQLRAQRGEFAALEEGDRKQRAAYEYKRAQREMAEKKEEQRILTTTLGLAKYLFATSMGFFSAGGWLALALMVPGGPAVTGIVLAVTSPFLAAMFFFSARMNWLTTNDEMGPLFKKLFFNPAHSGWGFFKRLRHVIWQSEISVPATVRTLKGATNLVAAGLIGFLTFLGSVSLLTLMMSQIPVGAALTFGTFLGIGGVTWPVLLISGVLAAAATLIYFVISNVYQHDRESREKYNERLNKLGKINGLGEKGGQKVYSRAIAASMLGIGTTLLASFSALTFIKGFGLAQTVHFAAGALSVSVPVFGIIIAAVIMIGFYGISSFYIHRTRNTAQNKVCDKIGGRFSALKGMAGQDVTGREAPDFKEAAFGKDNLLYSTNENKIGSRNALLVNSVGQAGQSVKGGVFTFMPIGAVVGALMGGPVGALVGTIVGALAGVGAGVAAGMASYNANSVGSRQVKHRVTEVNTIAHDLSVFNRYDGIRKESDVDVRAGEAKANIEFYRDERAGNRADHYGFGGYRKDAKVAAANALIDVLDDKGTEEDKNAATRQTLFNAYNSASTAKARCAMTQGSLGKLAREVEVVERQRSSHAAH